jgi:hypothetical protein
MLDSSQLFSIRKSENGATATKDNVLKIAWLSISPKRKIKCSGKRKKNNLNNVAIIFMFCLLCK